jgi:hypothetical protein
MAVTDKTLPDATAPPEPLHFAMRFTSTPRGARLARRMAEHLLDAWGFTYDSEPHDTFTLIVAELCANAAQHGRVPGRDFHLRLSLTPAAPMPPRPYAWRSPTRGPKSSLP